MSYYIYVNGVVNDIYTLTQSTPSIEISDLLLPCSQKLWKARTAREWKLETYNTQADRGTLKATMMLLLGDPNRTEDEQPDDYLVHSPFSMHILIHGIAGAVLELNRNMPSRSSKSVRLLKTADFKTALAQWRRHFDLMDRSAKEEGISISALICYHLTHVLIDADVDGILKAIGLYTPNHSALAPGTSTLPFLHPGEQDVYPHLLYILQLCFSGSNASNEPLCIAKIEVLTLLVMWVCVREAINNEPQQPELVHNDTSSVEQDTGRSMGFIEDALRRENIRANAVNSNLAAMKRDLYESILIAQGKLLNNTSEFGMSYIKSFDTQS